MGSAAGDVEGVRFVGAEGCCEWLWEWLWECEWVDVRGVFDVRGECKVFKAVEVGPVPGVWVLVVVDMLRALEGEVPVTVEAGAGGVGLWCWTARKAARKLA